MRVYRVVLLCAGLLWNGLVVGQQNPGDHEAHHPGAAAASPPASTRPPTPMEGLPYAEQAPPQMSSPTPGMQGGAQGMAGGMEKMMEGMMGEGARKEIYPSMMRIPILTPAARTELERLAEERIHAGMLSLETATGRLSEAIATGSHDDAEYAMELSRDGLARVNSGVAVHRLLRDGGQPQQAALQWFRRSMELPTPRKDDGRHGFFGLTWVHYFSMTIFAAFAGMMAVFRYLKLKRAAALLEAIPSSVSAGSADHATPVDLAPIVVNEDIAPSKTNSWTGQLRVAQIFDEAPQVKTFRLTDPGGGKLPFTYLPGQFLTFTVYPNEQAVKRSYTIASAPTRRDYCEVTVRHEDKGVVSGYLHDFVKVGSMLQTTAPSGKFTFTGQTNTSIVLIAGGVGVTPMMSVVRYLTDRSWYGNIYLIYGCKSSDDVIYREEIEYLKKRHANLHVSLVAESPAATSWPYHVGRINRDILVNAVPDIVSQHFHICGPKPMMDAIKSLLASLGVPAEQVETEVFIGREPPRKEIAALSQAPRTHDAQDSGARSVPPNPGLMATFARSRKIATLRPDSTILEASEDIGVNIDYSCRIGTCGACKVKLLSGTVAMEVEDALDSNDKADNIILACQAKPLTSVSIDA